jgi:hypothetical protein
VKEMEEQQSNQTAKVQEPLNEIVNYMLGTVMKKQNGEIQQACLVEVEDPIIARIYVLHDECLVTKESYWLYFTCGFSDIYKEMQDETQGDTISGYGFELMIRLRRNKLIEYPIPLDGNENILAPTWPVGLFKSLANYVHQSGLTFNHGDYKPGSLVKLFVAPEHDRILQHIEEYLNECQSVDTTPDPSAFEALEYFNSPVHLTSYLFSHDQYLKTITTDSGSVQFIQVVPITQDELMFAKSWNTKSFLKIMGEKAGIDPSNSERVNPLLICDIHRESILNDEVLYQECQIALNETGSITSAVMLKMFQFDRQSATTYMITFCESDIKYGIRDLLLNRVLFYRELRLVSNSGCTIYFYPLEELDVSSTSNPSIPLPPPNNTLLKVHATEQQQANQEYGQSYFLSTNASTLLLKCSNEFVTVFANTDFTAVTQFYEWPDLLPGIIFQVVHG